MMSALLYYFRKYFRRNNAIRYGAEVRNSKLGKFINISRYCFVTNSSINDYTSIGRNSVIVNAIIGKFSSISWNVTIGATKHNYKKISSHAFTYLKYYGFTNRDNRIEIETKIGNDVWIGANVVIMPGIKVGDGAVIGAGSVVTKNIDDYQIVYGVPAKPKGYRFEKDEIEYIKGLKWWEWSHDELKRKIELFKSPFKKAEEKNIH